MEINLDEIICQFARLHRRRMELANILSEWIRNPGKGSTRSSNPKNFLLVHFRGLVWKWVWKMTFFGLKQGQDLENRAAHPHQEFPGVLPGPFSRVTNGLCEYSQACWALRFFASTSRYKKFALHAASSLGSTRKQRALLIFSACSNPCGNPFL